MRILAASFLLALVSAAPESRSSHEQSVIKSTKCNGDKYNYLGLAGYGLTASNSRDKYGDTAGGIGSSAAIDPKSWKKSKDSNSYSGTLWALPDRGWNTEGTLNFNPRVHKFHITFDPKSKGPSPNLELEYQDSILFTDPAGNPCTGLDPDFHGPYLPFPGFPDLPSSTYSGDGFGGEGAGGRRVSLDTEGLVLNSDGTFWISDEYGPFIYHFDSNGRMIAAIRPPEPFIPKRNDSDSFSAASPPRYDPDRQVVPENGPTGRHNNQGFEGLTASPDGKYLYVLAQSALNQDGGNGGDEDRRYARLLQYTAASPNKVVAEYVVPLPLYDDNDEVAAQSEIKFISSTQFLVLARDSGAGHGQDDSKSKYRHVDIFDISKATDVNGQFTIAPNNGTLDKKIKPAEYCSWLDYNDNSELKKFGLHNGGDQDAGLLNEKWESLALVPVLDKGCDDEYFLFSLSDNDFITQDGYMKAGEFRYSDESGFNLDNQVLVFRVKLPKAAKPRLG